MSLPRLVLASGSAARAAMLRAAGVPFTVQVPVVDEAGLKAAFRAQGAPIEEAAVALAELKAHATTRLAPMGAIVLAADQMLEVEGSWLDKPADRAAARTQLLQLRDRPHRLVVAAVATIDGVRAWHEVDAATVTFRAFSEAALAAVLDAEGDAVLGSVGAYRLEGAGAQLVRAIHGSHFTILGLPLLPLLAWLRERGVLAA